MVLMVLILLRWVMLHMELQDMDTLKWYTTLFYTLHNGLFFSVIPYKMHHFLSGEVTHKLYFTYLYFQTGYLTLYFIPFFSLVMLCPKVWMILEADLITAEVNISHLFCMKR